MIGREYDDVMHAMLRQPRHDGSVWLGTRRMPLEQAQATGHGSVNSWRGSRQARIGTSRMFPVVTTRAMTTTLAQEAATGVYYR